MDAFNVKELIEYLHGFPEDTEVHINVIDCQKAVDITARKDDPDEKQEDKDEKLGS